MLIGGDGADVLRGGAGDDVLIGGPGNDTLDGAPGDDVVLQSVATSTVRSAEVAGRRWVKTHVRTVKGKTVLRVDGEKRKLPRADLADLLA